MSYRDVFGEVLADHHESPRFWGELDQPTKVEEGYNPLCGDQVKLSLKIEDGVLKESRFVGEGCSICMASASIMEERIQNCQVQDLKKLIAAFREKMQGAEKVEGLPEENEEDDLVALYGIKRFPVRIKCALLPWTTLLKGIES